MTYYNKGKNTGSIWIIGLSSAGKSALARLLVNRLWEKGCPNILLDGTQIRDIFEERLGYDIKSRRKQTRRMMGLTKWISSQGILPVVAMIHPFEDDRVKCRNSLRGYFEVYLKCSLKACIERDAKNVYLPTLDGKTKNVVGIDIPYEAPGRADVVLESAKLSPEQMLEILWSEIEKKFFMRSDLCAE